VVKTRENIDQVVVGISVPLLLEVTKHVDLRVPLFIWKMAAAAAAAAAAATAAAVEARLM
jgi:hypothetical protein